MLDTYLADRYRIRQTLNTEGLWQVYLAGDSEQPDYVVCRLNPLPRIREVVQQNLFAPNVLHLLNDLMGQRQFFVIPTNVYPEAITRQDGLAWLHTLLEGLAFLQEQRPDLLEEGAEGSVVAHLSGRILTIEAYADQQIAIDQRPVRQKLSPLSLSSEGRRTAVTLATQLAREPDPVVLLVKPFRPLPQIEINLNRGRKARPRIQARRSSFRLGWQWLPIIGGACVLLGLEYGHRQQQAAQERAQQALRQLEFLHQSQRYQACSSFPIPNISNLERRFQQIIQTCREAELRAQLGAAEELFHQQQFEEAIIQASRIPFDNPHHREAQQLIAIATERLSGPATPAPVAISTPPVAAVPARPRIRRRIQPPRARVMAAPRPVAPPPRQAAAQSGWVRCFSGGRLYYEGPAIGLGSTELARNCR